MTAAEQQGSRRHGGVGGGGGIERSGTPRLRADHGDFERSPETCSVPVPRRATAQGRAHGDASDRAASERGRRIRADRTSFAPTSQAAPLAADHAARASTDRAARVRAGRPRKAMTACASRGSAERADRLGPVPRRSGAARPAFGSHLRTREEVPSPCRA
jgi:hypothetical protein